MSSPQESFAALADTYAAITKEDCIQIQAGADDVVADAWDQIAVARQDLDALTAEGMPEHLIEDLCTAAEGFSWVAGRAAAAAEEDSTLRDEWQRKKKEGYDLRRRLLRYGDFGCRLNDLTTLAARLDEVRRGAGDADMILDLLSLHQLFTQHPEMTAGLIQFDTAWVQEALALHNHLKELRAAAKNPQEHRDELALQLKQAYTHYHRTVYELRAWGEFVFAGTPRFSAYQAGYIQKRYN
ncbi:MAG: hypothetical protein ACQEQV_08670 [Fibrobacterota bacterium]